MADRLDNTGDARFTAPGFFRLDATVALGLGRWIERGDPRLRVQCDNLLDNRRMYPSGYSYRFLVDGVVDGTSYYYPLATRSLFVSLELKF